MKPICRKVCFGLRLALLALTFPLAIAALMLIWQDHNSRREAVITQVEIKSAQINAQLEDFVHRVDAATSVFAVGWVNDYGPEAAHPTELSTMNSSLLRLVNSRPEFTTACITDAGGLVISASDPSLVGNRVKGDLPYERVVATREFTATDVFVQEGNEAAPYAQFLQPLIWGNGTVQGFLIAKSELSAISEALDMSMGFPASAKSGIFDSTGKILAGTGYEAPHPGMAAGRDISASAVWAQASTRPTTEWFGLGLDKVDRIIFFGYPDSTPWVTTVAYSQSELFDPLWDRVWTFAGVLGLTLIAVIVVGEMFVRRERRNIESIETERVTLDAVMNGATDGIMVIDNQDSVNFTNRSLTELIGLEQGSLIRKSVADAQSLIANLGDDPEEALSHLKDAMKVDSRVQVSHLALKDTVGLEFEITSYPVKTEGGMLLGRTLVFHDVSKAKAVSRMKSQFLMTASHQLRTPMASILTFAELSISREAPLPKQRQWMGLIQQQATRMVSTINSMLNVSEIEAGRLELNFEDVDAGEVCQTIIKEFESSSPDHIFRIDLPDIATRVTADSVRFNQIVQNLVDNAVKYTPKSGNIGIMAEAPSNGMVHFRVSDTGIGIAAEAQRRLFQPFSRVSDEQTSAISGSGLGLYIARNLVRQHGGDMWLESEPGEGTTVHFTLPSATSAPTSISNPIAAQFPDTPTSAIAPPMPG
jgi:signal transduction histidine kinase